MQLYTSQKYEDQHEINIKITKEKSTIIRFIKIYIFDWYTTAYKMGKNSKNNYNFIIYIQNYLQNGQ
jgi:hypothetical protein